MNIFWELCSKYEYFFHVFIVILLFDAPARALRAGYYTFLMFKEAFGAIAVRSILLNKKGAKCAVRLQNRTMKKAIFPFLGFV